MSEKVGERNAGGGDARSTLRRRDRGKEEPWVREFMKRSSMGFLATVDEEHCIYLHTHRDQIEVKAALQSLLDKYAPHLTAREDYRPSTDEELAQTAVYRIDIETWSGKQKEVEPDFPGAYALPDLPVPFPGRGAQEA